MLPGTKVKIKRLNIYQQADTDYKEGKKVGILFDFSTFPEEKLITTIKTVIFDAPPSKNFAYILDSFPIYRFHPNWIEPLQKKKLKLSDMLKIESGIKDE